MSAASDTGSTTPTRASDLASALDRPALPEPRPLPATMRAVVRDRYGRADALQLRTDVPVPAPGPGQVLVEVHAAGVDRGVWHLMLGRPYLVRLAGYGVRRPRQPVIGSDVAGRVVALGDGVSNLSLGQAVFGTAAGSYAEYAVAEADHLQAIPAGISFAHAATLGTSADTAVQALDAAGGVRSGTRVLVIGASGGVGSFAVQLARAGGATVTAVASGAKADLVRALGADEVIDYATEDVTSRPERYDVILDIGGRTAIGHLRRILSPDGHLVLVGGENGGAWTGGFHRQMGAAVRALLDRRYPVSVLLTREDAATRRQVADAVSDGRLRAPVGHRYPLADAGKALTDLEKGRISGKAVLDVRPVAAS